MRTWGRRGWWLGALVLAAGAGIAVALWRAPDTVSIPVGASPDSLPAPMPAPPNLADATPPGSR